MSKKKTKVAAKKAVTRLRIGKTTKKPLKKKPRLRKSKAHLKLEKALSAAQSELKALNYSVNMQAGLIGNLAEAKDLLVAEVQELRPLKRDYWELVQSMAKALSGMVDAKGEVARLKVDVKKGTDQVSGVLWVWASEQPVVQKVAHLILTEQRALFTKSEDFELAVKILEAMSFTPQRYLELPSHRSSWEIKTDEGTMQVNTHWEDAVGADGERVDMAKEHGEGVVAFAATMSMELTDLEKRAGLETVPVGATPAEVEAAAIRNAKARDANKGAQA